MMINQKLDNDKVTIIAKQVGQIEEQYSKRKSLVELCFYGVLERKLL